MTETPRLDCANCGGRGVQDGTYTHGPRLCSACYGSGKEPRDGDDEALQMVERMIRNRMEWGHR